MVLRSRWHDIPAAVVAPFRRPLLPAVLGLGGVGLWLVAGRAEEPAPLALHMGGIYAAVALIAAMAGHHSRQAPQEAGMRPFLASALRAGVLVLAVHGLARLLGMPALPHPVSTTLALLLTIFFCAGLSALWPALPGGDSWLRIGLVVLVVMGQDFGNDGIGKPAWLLALSPGHWAQAAIQTALTGTGTRAAASVLAALAGVAAFALLAGCLSGRRWPLALLAASWLGLSALVWQRPPPPLPRADPWLDYSVSALVDLASRDKPIAPIATSAPDPALASALDRVKRQIAGWPPADAADARQRAVNLLLIAAVPDLYDTEPLQSHLPLLVLAELRARVPAAALPGVLADIAAHPEQGSVAARLELPTLGLPANTGDEAAVRKRVAVYAARLGRLVQDQSASS